MILLRDNLIDDGLSRHLNQLPKLQPFQSYRVPMSCTFPCKS
jgi:hypothetical protein